MAWNDPESLAKVAVVDIETTGLDPDRHEIWEIGVYLPDKDESHHWFLTVDEAKADLISLNIGGYFQRHPEAMGYPPNIAERVRFLTLDRHLVGNCVSFDADFLSRFLRNNGKCPAWHHHLVDVEALAAGYLGLPPPWDSDVLNEKLGVTAPTDEERHTALGDCMWAWRMYCAVMEGRSGKRSW